MNYLFSYSFRSIAITGAFPVLPPNEFQLRMGEMFYCQSHPQLSFNEFKEMINSPENYVEVKYIMVGNKFLLPPTTTQLPVLWEDCYFINIDCAKKFG